MTITASTTLHLLAGEVLTLTSWYALTDRELTLILLGASLGLKVNNVESPDLELAIIAEKPEIFLDNNQGGYYHGRTEITHKESNQQVSCTGNGGDQE